MFKFLLEPPVFDFGGYVPRSGIAGSCGNSMLSLEGTPKLCSPVTVSFYIPTSNGHGLQFLQIIASAYFQLFTYLFVYYSRPRGWDLIVDVIS